MIKRMIEKQEKYYKSHHDKDVNCLVAKNNNFKEMIGNLHGKIEDKNKGSAKL